MFFGQMIYRIVHNYEPSHYCEREDESSDYQLVQMNFHIEHICAISLHCELEGVSSDYLLDQKICGKLANCKLA